MIHQPEYVKAIMKRYVEGTATPVELARLKAAWNIYDDDELADMIAEILPEINVVADNELDSWEPPLNEIIKRSKDASRQNAIDVVKKALSESALYLIIIGGTVFLFWMISRPSKLLYSCGHLPDDSESPTGVYSCKLTLDNSCTILIDRTYQGRVAMQGNVEILKLPTGELKYRKSFSGMKDDSIKVRYNIITTSPGDQYKVILPDGTKVRLNATSSIRFPVNFSESNRIIEIAGEVFLDVAPDKNMPFYVKVKNTEIKVLGTSFNVNAYSEKIQTTLVSGRLEIKNGSNNVILKPGEKAVITDNQQNLSETNSSILIFSIDTSDAISWRKIKRVYTKIPMRDFVLDIGRWYNLEMVNMDCVPYGFISASLCYDTPLSEVLAMFRKTGLRFNREGNRIIFCEPTKEIERPQAL